MRSFREPPPVGVPNSGPVQLGRMNHGIVAQSAAPQIPDVTLLGPGFLSRGNVALGWGLTWRVGLANAALSAALRTALALARGDVAFDIVERALLFAATTVAGLLVTDWAGRRMARTRYHLSIDRFIGFAILWREAVASFAWGSVAGLFVGGGMALIQLGAAEALQTPLMIGWIVAFTPLIVVLGLAGAGWSGHRVYILQRKQTQRDIEHQVNPPAVSQVRSDNLHADAEPAAVGER